MRCAECVTQVITEDLICELKPQKYVCLLLDYSTYKDNIEKLESYAIYEYLGTMR
jgi:hypothetical protein